MVITICGGGSLGHVCIGVLSSQKDIEVRLLTGHPDSWSDTIVVKDQQDKTYNGKISICSSNPRDVIPGADMVLLCLPGYLIEKTLSQIRPYLTDSVSVGTIVSSTGFFFFAHSILPSTVQLFGFQRVPFIARVNQYGQSANLLGYKNKLYIALENISDKDCFRSLIEHLFSTPTEVLGSYYEAALTNSNPILHTARLYSMWHNWDGTPYERNPYFYREWTLEAAQLLIDMDREFKQLLEVLPMNSDAIPSLLDYYESSDAVSLRDKLSSIAAFQNITSPMSQTEDGWIPDFKSRYFTEDFPFGLRFIVELAKKYEVSTPNMDLVFQWGISKCN